MCVHVFVHTCMCVCVCVCVTGWQDRLALGAGPAALQRCAGGDPHLPPGLPQPHPLPGVPTALRAPDAKRHPPRLHGWQEGCGENGGCCL